KREFGVLIVDADPAFDGDGDFHRALHGPDASCDKLRLRHQASAEAAVFDPIGRAADIEIDFIITKILADLRRHREVNTIGPAKLERDGMFAGVKTEQPRAIAVNDGA